MSYLSNFKYDVFLSYSHVDNATSDDTEKGWITHFYEELKLMLATRVGRLDLAQIWWDEQLTKNQVFSDEIKDAITNSAFFITFASNGYYSSAFCRKELKWFYENISTNSFGISIKNTSRIYNILLNKKSHEDWPPECKGVNAYEMYELYHPERDKLGYPLNRDSELFTKGIKEIANDIYESMLLIEKQTTSVSKDNTDEEKTIITKPKVFIAKVSDTLITEKNQIIKELEANNIEVIQKAFPPPYDKSKHEKAVTEALHEACLSIHLFDQMPGDKIEEDMYTFSQAQANIARQLSKDQLIFIPKELNLNDIHSDDHKKFLQQLQNNKKDNDKYSLIREFAVPNIIHEIKEKINESAKKVEISTTTSPLIRCSSTFMNRITLMLSIWRIFYLTIISKLISRYKSNPTENINDYEAQLKMSVP